MTKLLDCTLRDGGYYNDWNFPIETAKQTIASLEQAGVDIIEVGLKSAADTQCSGLFKYCNEDYLGFLEDFPRATFSFMLNVKEFILDQKINQAALDKIIKPAESSPFKLCRLATHYADIDLISDFYQYFHANGYQVGINLMGISLLSDEQIQRALNIVEGLEPDVFYIADSFGSMLPEDVSATVAMLKKHYSGNIGIHTHDNQGLAFANSLRALDEGVEYIDATLTGMGRGAGNLSTEQILLWLQNRGSDKSRYHSSKVLDIIHSFYEPLKEHFKWGFNYVYMLSGLNNIHPVYCMELCDGNKFSMSRISTILEQIPNEKHASYDRDALDTSINHLPIERQSISDNPGLSTFPVALESAKQPNCLIVSTGPGIAEYQYAIDNLVTRLELPLLECNDTGIVDQIAQRLTVILNRMRLNEVITRTGGGQHKIVTGESTFDGPEIADLFHFDVQIGDFEILENRVSIPDFEAGQFTISLALALGYRQIYMAGFTGYEEPGKNEKMEMYFTAVNRHINGAQLISITPTQYQNLKQASIYTL